jgi:predicted Fe-Mo cluster-binding NifX family protein
MKIVVTSTGAGKDSAVDERFGRAACFLVYDSETGEYEAVDNGNARGAAQGAGIKAAETVSKCGADVVITGHCGPKAFQALRTAGIAVVLGSAGTVEEMVGRYLGNELEEAAGPDVKGR